MRPFRFLRDICLGAALGVILAAVFYGCASRPCDPKLAALAVQMMGEEGRCR